MDSLVCTWAARNCHIPKRKIKMILQIFDFDGTLMSTNDKPLTNEAARDVGWNGRDWWGSACSLDDVKFHTNVRNAFEMARNDPDTLTVLATGRRGIIAWRIREILRQAGMPGRRMIPASNKQAINHFNDKQPNEENSRHLEYFCGDFVTEEDYPRGKKGNPVDNTWTHKQYVVQGLIKHNITEMHMWDDRKDHFPLWIGLSRQLIKQIPIIIVHQVFPQHNVENPYIVNHCLVNEQGKIRTSTQNGNHITQLNQK